MADIRFNPRWREELEAISEEGKLIFEFTIGQMHVFFPDKARWLNIVPAWAKEKWQVYLEACTKWCQDNKIPISIVGDAHVYEER